MAINANERFNRVTVGRGRSANRNRTRGSGSSAGVFNPKFLTNLNRQNSITPKGGNEFLSGLIGSSRDAGKYGQADLEYNENLREDILRKTTPDVNFVGGTTRYRQNPDGTYSYTSEADAANTQIREDAIRRQGMFGQQAEDLAAGGWRDAQKSRYGDLMSIYEEELAVADQLRRARELNTGASSTQQMLNQMNADASTNRLKLAAMNQAFNQSQALIDNNLARSAGQYNMLTGVEDKTNRYLNIPAINATGNLGNVSDANTRLNDQLAYADQQQAQGKSDFWGSIFGAVGNTIAPGIGGMAGNFLGKLIG